MIVCGFDTSLTTSGCAAVNFDPVFGDVREWLTWRARVPAPEVPSPVATMVRIRVMLKRILQHVPDVVDLAVIEGPSMGGKMQASLKDERAGLRWMLVNELVAHDIPVVLVTPTSRAYLAAQHGHASKVQVRDAMRLRQPHAHIPDHNVADAVALAEAGAFALGLRVPYTAEQMIAHAKVAWPDARRSWPHPGAQHE